MGKIKTKVIPIGIQSINIKKDYCDTVVKTDRDQQLTWLQTITPSPMGGWYTVKGIYYSGKSPKVLITEPKPLALPGGKEYLPHCYDSKKQHLCLFYPDNREWNSSMLISQTIIPWTFEWLYHYEIWLGNGGIWTGGGVHSIKKNDS